MSRPGWARHWQARGEAGGRTITLGVQAPDLDAARALVLARMDPSAGLDWQVTEIPAPLDRDGWDIRYAEPPQAAP